MLSFPETYAILWNDNSMSIKATARELYDAINHKYALSLTLGDGSVELRESLIKAIAEQINKSINDISGYRRVQVVIRGAEHIPPAPQQVVSLMMELVYAYNSTFAVAGTPSSARPSSTSDSSASIPSRAGTAGRGAFCSTGAFCSPTSPPP